MNTELTDEQIAFLPARRVSGAARVSEPGGARRAAGRRRPGGRAVGPLQAGRRRTAGEVEGERHLLRPGVRAAPQPVEDQRHRQEVHAGPGAGTDAVPAGGYRRHPHLARPDAAEAGRGPIPPPGTRTTPSGPTPHPTPSRSGSRSIRQRCRTAACTTCRAATRSAPGTTSRSPRRWDCSSSGFHSTAT